jgi:hypothetical protein
VQPVRHTPTGGHVDQGDLVFRKVAVVLTVVVVQAGLLVGLSGVAWALPPLSGTVTCNPFAGAGHFNHQIRSNGTASGLTIHYTGTLSGCNGTFGTYHVTGGTVTASGTFTHSGGDVNKCANFEGSYPASDPNDMIGTIHVRVHWTTSPTHAWAPSRVTYKGSFADLLYPNLNQPHPGPPYTALDIVIQPPLNGGSTVTTVTGSYAGTGAVTNMLMVVPATSAATGCPIGPAFTFNSLAMAFP